MADPKKGIAALIVAKAKPQGAPAPQGEPDGDEAEGEGDDMGKHAAAEDMIAALDKRDPVAFSQALSSFIEMCHSY